VPETAILLLKETWRLSCNHKDGLISLQLSVLRGESASVKMLQSTTQALEQDKANLQERVQRLEKELAAGGDGINKSSGNTGITSEPRLTHLVALILSFVC